MAILSVREINSGRTGSQDDRPQREYERTIQVLTSSALDGALTVRQAVGVPRIGDIYADANGAIDLLARCKRLRARVDNDNPQRWEVTAEYSTLVADPGQNPENPVDRAAKISWSMDRFRKPIAFDLYGLPIVTSSLGRFDPAPEIDDSRLVLRIRRNQLSFDPLLALAYQDAVNTDSFFGAGPGRAKVFNIDQGERTVEGTYLFYPCTYEIHFRREGWDLVLIDQDYSELVNDKRQEILSERDASNLSGPVFLDGRGKKAGTKPTTLAAACSATATTIVVASAMQPDFPDTAPFRIRVEDEIMMVTGGVGLGASVNWPVIRGLDGSPAAAHVSGTKVKQTAQYLTYRVYKQLPYAGLGLP